MAKAAGEKTPKRPEKPSECGFVFPRTVCKREITREEAQAYIRDEKTELLTDFTSRFGRPFSAILFLKETGKHGFEFPPRGKAAKDGAAEEKPGPKKAGRKAAPRKKVAKATRKKTTKKAATKKKATKKKAAGAAKTKKATRKKASTKKAKAASKPAADAPDSASD